MSWCSRAAGRAALTPPSNAARVARAAFRNASPRGGELDLARVAPQQLGAQIGFELVDLLAQRLLRDEQPGCRPAEVQIVGDGDK